MQHLTTRRVLLTLFLIAILSASGAFAGYLAGREIVLESTESKLAAYATGLETRGEAASAEARDLLAKINASSYAPCSEEELSYLRRMLYLAQYLKEAGRISAGKIVCSATLGKLQEPFSLPQPKFSGINGMQYYINLPAFRIKNQPSVGMQWKDAYIVYRANVFDIFEPFRLHATVTILDKAGNQPDRLLGNGSQISSQDLVKDSQSRSGKVLYATRCPKQFLYCMTAYLTTEEALQINKRIMIGYISVGSLGGIGLGVIVVLLYYRKKTLEQQLQRAIRKDTLFVVYQPIVDLSSRKTVGAEALVRWIDEDGYTHNPEMFVKLAEDRGFISDITELVLRHAIRDFRKTLQEDPGFKLSINITASDLSNPKFIPMLEGYINRSGILPCNIGLELTESSTADRSVAVDAIMKLHAFGHSILIDDFGTGYSSLSYLHELSIDGIKIDRCFTNAIGTQAVLASILPKILEMVKTLKLNTVIEGIETESQADYFRDAVPDGFAQGWLFGRPVSAEEFYATYMNNLVETTGTVL